MGNCSSDAETPETGRGFGRMGGGPYGRRGGNGARNRRRNRLYSAGLTDQERATLTTTEAETQNETSELETLKREAASAAKRLQDLEQRIDQLQTETSDQ